MPAREPVYYHVLEANMEECYGIMTYNKGKRRDLARRPSIQSVVRLGALGGGS